MGSNNIPQSYYDKARNTVPPATGVTLSTDPGYGVTQKQPVCVGDKTNPKTRNVFSYLNVLRGPQGQEISYRRMGSCCPFKTPNGIVDGMAVLNAYMVTWADNPKPMIVYINNYDEGPMATPFGLTLAKP